MIYFTGVRHLPGRSKKQIFQAFKELFRFYICHGFRIKTVRSDGKFAPLKPMIEGIPRGPYVNVAAANKHAPDIEQRNHVVKELTQRQQQILAINQFPKIMTISCVLKDCRLLKKIPS